RMRDRAQELLDEEASLASTLAVTWGADDDRAFPRLSLQFDRLLAHTRAGAVSLLATPDHPDTPRVAASAFDPVVGDADALARRLRALAGEGYRVVLAAEGTGSAQRLRDVLAGEGVDAGDGEPAPAARCARSPRSSSCSTGSASPPRGGRSVPTRRGSTRWRRRSPTRRRPTSSRPSTT